MNLSQQRFLLDPSKDQHDTIWRIPVTFSGPATLDFDDFRMNGNLKTVWLVDRQLTFSAEPTERDDWLLTNLLSSSYFRVNYDETNWRMILDQLRTDPDAFEPTNRAQFIDDTMNLAKSKHVSYFLALEFLDSLLSEEHYLPWSAGLRAIEYFDNMLVSTRYYGTLKKYVSRLILPALEARIALEARTGFDKSLESRILMSELMHWACKYNMPICERLATAEFSNWIESEAPITPDFRQPFYCHGIERSDSADWDLAWNRATNTSNLNEKIKLLRALTCTSEQWMIIRLFERTFDVAFVEWEMCPKILEFAASTNTARFFAWPFFRTYFDTYAKRYGGEPFTLPNLVKAITSGMTSEFELKELQRFIEENKNNLGFAKVALDKAVEQVQNNVKWIADNVGDVMEWMESRVE